MMRIRFSLISAVIAVAALSLACNFPGTRWSATPIIGLTPGSPTQPQIVTATPIPPGETPQISAVPIYLVALEDNGQSGIPIGCGDSLVIVNRPVEPTTEPVRAALQELFEIKEQMVGESGLYNALWQSNLLVESVVVDPGGIVRVSLTGQFLLGGTSDNPRFQGQIEETARTAAGAASVLITINGLPIDQVLSGQ